MQPHLQERPADPPGVLKQRYVTAAAVLAWGAYAALVYVVLVRGLQLARDTAFPLTIGNIGTIERAEPINIWFPLFPVAFFLAALLPLATKYCIAFIVSIKGKDALSRWAKGILIVITLACIVSTLTATGPLMIESAGGKYREAAVKGELVEARVTAEKQIYADMQTSLDKMKTATSYEGAAAREGVAGWSAKVAIAKKQLDAGQLEQARFDRIERASSAAAAREDLERQMRDQQVKIASLPTASTALATVKSDESHGAQEFAEVSSAYWPLSAFFALEMIAVFFGLIELVLMLTRDRQLADWEAVHAQPTADPGIDLRLDDHSNETQVRPQETILEEDPETGELIEKVRVRYKNEDYFRKKPTRKAKPKKDDPRAAQMFDALPEEEQNLEEEVGDVAKENNGYGEPLVGETDGDGGSGQREGGDFQETISGEYSDDRGAGAGEESAQALPEVHVQAESLTHAEEDQQADELGGEVEGENLEAEAGTGTIAGLPFERDSRPFGETDEQSGLNDPLQAPDEQAVWNEASETSELAELENEEANTPLPNGEGVLVRTDAEIEELERQYAARRAVEAAE